MRTTVTVEDGIVRELLRETGAKNLPQAIHHLIEAWERKQKVAKLMSFAGKVKFSMTYEEMRAMDREREAERLKGWLEPRPSR